jgi:hypothetical protein
VIDLLEFLVYGAILLGRIYLAHRHPASTEDDAWTRTDLSTVPDVIEQPAAEGHLLPWYRRVLRRAPPSGETSRELTTYRS